MQQEREIQCRISVSKYRFTVAKHGASASKPIFVYFVIFHVKTKNNFYTNIKWLYLSSGQCMKRPFPNSYISLEKLKNMYSKYFIILYHKNFRIIVNRLFILCFMVV